MNRFSSIGWLCLSVLLAGCGSMALEKQGADDSDTVRDYLTVQPLKSGETVTGLAGAKGEEHHFSVTVPEGATNLRIVQSGGTGDADLYVRFNTDVGARRGSWDYRPFIDGNDETVVPVPLKAGTWFFMVRGFTPYSAVSVVATFDPPPAPIDAGTTPPDATDAGAPPPPPPPTGPDCLNPASWPAAWVAFEDEVISLVNQQRAAGATCGTASKPAVGPLATEAHLRQAARCHSLDMATHNYFSHDSQDGRNPFDRMVAAGYTQWTTLGENIAAGQPTPTEVMKSWMNSEGHCNNIMSGGFADIGIGFAFDESADFDRYWTQDFGHH